MGKQLVLISEKSMDLKKYFGKFFCEFSNKNRNNIAIFQGTKETTIAYSIFRFLYEVDYKIVVQI